MAYLKVHYKNEFFANLLTNMIGSEIKTKEYIEEAKSKEIIIEKPDINKSTDKYIVSDNKIISFRGKGLIVDLIVTFPEDKPQLFKNVTTNVVKLSDGTLCYTVSSIAGSKTYNRRQSYRCYVGIETAVQCGLNRAAHDAIIKDISYNGFSVVSREDLKLEVNQTIHTVLNDHMDETAENFNFHLYGLVARIQELENGLFLYGCRLNNPVPGLEQYIIKKERAVLRKRQLS